MGRSAIPPALFELLQSGSPEGSVDALRKLKNEIVGHEQRKELVVSFGVVKPLAVLLEKKGGKRRRGVTNGSTGAPRESERVQAWTANDESRFQATLVVGSLANGESPAWLERGVRGNQS